MKNLTIQRQCELIGLARASYYYQSKGEAELNLELMRMLDEQYTATPFYGVEKMTEVLRLKGYQVNRKRVRRLLRLMGLEAVYPKRNKRLAETGEESKRYPYLLRGLEISRVNQVWTADITYIRLLYGFCYLVAVMDWYSRYVLAWRISNTLESGFCLEALAEALAEGCPEICNTDLGSQFTSIGWIEKLEQNSILVSHDGRGRVFDNIMIERLWRTVKYEEVYLQEYFEQKDAESGLGSYFPFYNNERLHQSLRMRKPREIYREGLKLNKNKAIILSP